MKLLKKHVKKANAWLVWWQERENKKIIDKREWFVSEELADEFIKQKNEERNSKNI